MENKELLAFAVQAMGNSYSPYSNFAVGACVLFESGKDYLFPTDALHFIETDGAQYNYGYKEGYFDSMISTIEEVSTTDFTTLVENIKKAKSLSERALADIKAEEYANTAEYSGSFNDGRSQYKMNKADAYEKEMETIYREFAEWLAEWEI
jgi:hypothetical protein